MVKKIKSRYTQLEPPTLSEPSIQRPEKRALIGSSLVVKGDLVCDETLTLLGRLEGKLSCKEDVIIGTGGRAKAEIHAKVISIEGEVEGHLCAEEKIVIHQSGNVHGTLSAPRVALEDGCKFKGVIEVLDQQGSSGRTRLGASSKN
ncbi:polymer-forming cytoskeletal protein [Acidobacteria bacterium AH-259-A15]|nr:polymer-forming cytoskeletal protein [Acidobacteria bacterium AH-259-A15]